MYAYYHICGKMCVSACAYKCTCMWPSETDIGMIPISIDCYTLFIEAGCLSQTQNLVS